MKLVKNLRKQYQDYINTPYYQSTLSGVYTRPSQAKINAFEYCERLYYDYVGEGLKIIGYNTFSFSVGFIGYYEDKKAFFYITKDYDRVMLLED